MVQVQAQTEEKPEFESISYYMHYEYTVVNKGMVSVWFKGKVEKADAERAIKDELYRQIKEGGSIEVVVTVCKYLEKLDSTLVDAFVLITNTGTSIGMSRNAIIIPVYQFLEEKRYGEKNEQE